MTESAGRMSKVDQLAAQWTHGHAGARERLARMIEEGHRMRGLPYEVWFPGGYN